LAVQLEGKRENDDKEVEKNYWKTSHIVKRLSQTELLSSSGTIYRLIGELTTAPEPRNFGKI